MYKQRKTDRLIGLLSAFFDWVDDRDVDKHIVSMAIFFGTVKVSAWAMEYSSKLTDKSGLEVAAVIAAVMAPYMALQAAAVKFYFDSRQK